MGFVSLFLLFFIPTKSFAAAPHKEIWNQTWRNLPQLVNILKTVPQGLAVLRKAENKDPLFVGQIKLGTASYTESTFSRTYSLIDGKEQITLHHEVTLNKELTLADAVEDLAHELVHFTEKGMLDPYRPGFELSQFIRNGIEGEGGELSALAVECKIAWTLERTYKGFPQHKLCESYRLPGNGFAIKAARRDYYALGSWFNHAGPTLKEALPEINRRAVVFTSSYAGKPYPIALSEEYAMTRKTACVNNRRKFRLIASQTTNKSLRKPASASLLWEERQRLKNYERLYCNSIAE